MRLKNAVYLNVTFSARDKVSVAETDIARSCGQGFSGVRQGQVRGRLLYTWW